MAPVRLADLLDRLGIDLGGLGVALAGAQNVAERRDDLDIVGALLRQRFEVFDRFLAASELLQPQADLDVGAWPHRRGLGDAVVDLDGALGLLQALQHVGEGHEREGVLRVEIQRETQVHDGRQLIALLPARRAEAVEHLCGPVLRRGRERTEGLAGAQLLERVAHDRMAGHEVFVGLVRRDR